MCQTHKEPPGWATDSLSRFIEDARQNTLATFNNLKGQYNLLKDIHLIFNKIVSHMNRTPDWFASFFLIRSHASFLGGVRLALSGQVPEAYMVLRGCLESALYGLYLSQNAASRETWLRRNDDEASKQKVRKEFTIRQLLDSLESIDQDTHRVASELYKRTIDLGAHPNEKAFLSVMKLTKDEDRITFDSAYLLGNTQALQLCLKSAALIGICSLDIFRNVFRERFDILSLTDQLGELKKGL